MWLIKLLSSNALNYEFHRRLNYPPYECNDIKKNNHFQSVF